MERRAGAAQKCKPSPLLSYTTPLVFCCKPLMKRRRIRRLPKLLSSEQCIAARCHQWPKLLSSKPLTQSTASHADSTAANATGACAAQARATAPTPPMPALQKSLPLMPKPPKPRLHIPPSPKTPRLRWKTYADAIGTETAKAESLGAVDEAARSDAAETEAPEQRQCGFLVFLPNLHPLKKRSCLLNVNQ